jgi:hypothetical protein
MRDGKAVYGLYASGFLLHERARLIRSVSGGSNTGDVTKRGLSTENARTGEGSSNQAMQDARRHETVP